jgi:hypothetical protein
MLDREELQESLDRVMLQEGERYLATVPYARHLTDESQELDEEYYLRHRVETIRRIRMTAKIDGFALAHMIDEDYDAARWWSRYITEELNHDLLFIEDLRLHGYSDGMVAGIEPFQSTIDMLNYLTTKIDSLGALPAVAYALFTEWNSERYSAQVVEKAEAKYSASHVSGSKAHFRIDEDEDHYGMMLNIAHHLLAKHGNEKVLIDLITDISAFFCAYFRELYEKTVAQRDLKLVSQ